MNHRATLRTIAGLLIAGSVVAGVFFVITKAHMPIETGVHLDTSVSIVAFVIVFLIYRDDRKDAKALHAKLDALVKASTGADDGVRGLEERSESEVFRKAEHPET